MKVASAALVAGLAAQQAAAWNSQAQSYSNPANCNNKCSPEQQGGFSFGDQKTFSVGPLSSHGGISFSGGGGWSCASNFGKREVFGKRTGGCAKTSISKSSPASFSCGEQQNGGMSVDKMQLSTESPCDVELHYTMSDNSICKQTASCGKDVTTITNSQCGGAKSVDFYVANSSSVENIQLGVYSIGFDCNAASSTSAVSSAASTGAVSSSLKQTSPSGFATTTKPTPSGTSQKPGVSTYPGGSSAPSSSVPSSGSSSVPSPSSLTQTKPGVSTSLTQTKPAVSTSQTSPVGAGSTSPSKPGVSTTVLSSSGAGGSSASSVPLTTSTVYTTSVGTVYSCAASVTNCPAKSGSPVVVTSTIAVSTTVCPVTEGQASPTGPAQGSTKPSSPSSVASATVPTSTATAATGVPEVLPRCLNSWMPLTKCSSNTDYSCYCQEADFTSQVIDCVSAWAGEEEISAALSYLIGICAPYVPQNPGLITNCPSSVPIGTAPATSSVPQGTSSVVAGTGKSTVVAGSGTTVPGSSSTVVAGSGKSTVISGTSTVVSGASSTVVAGSGKSTVVSGTSTVVAGQSSSVVAGGSSVVPGQSSVVAGSGKTTVISGTTTVVPGSTSAAGYGTTAAGYGTTAAGYGTTSAAAGPSSVKTTNAAATSPAVTSAPQVQLTTIMYTATVTVPCTNGGVVSSTTSVKPTQIAVPQVAFQSSSAPGASASVNLVVGSASTAPATANSGAQTTAKAPYGNPAATTTAAFNTIAVPAGKNGTSPTPTPSPSPATYKGAASSVGFGLVAPLLAGAMAAMLAL